MHRGIMCYVGDSPRGWYWPQYYLKPNNFVLSNKRHGKKYIKVPNNDCGIVMLTRGEDLQQDLIVFVPQGSFDTA